MNNTPGTPSYAGPYLDWPEAWFSDYFTRLRERGPSLHSPFNHPAARFTAGNRANEPQIGQNICQYPPPPLPAIPYFSVSKIHEQKGVYHGGIKKTPIARAVIEILRGNSQGQ